MNHRGIPEVSKLKSTATYAEILELMKHPQNGVGFLMQHPSLPSQTFVSADAVQWLNNNLEGGVTVETAIGMMKVSKVFVSSNEYSLYF